MALASPTKKIDLELYTELAGIVEVAANWYHKTGNESCKKFIEELAPYLEQLDKKIKEHDYTAEDRVYWEFNRLSTGTL